jgi:hypothetical protein
MWCFKTLSPIRKTAGVILPFTPLKNDNGSVLIVSLILLVLLTVIGAAATRTAQIELRLSGNEKHHNMAFYAAEAAIGYVANRPELYGPLNMTEGQGPHYFPNDSEPYSPNLSDDSEWYELTRDQAFMGKVVFLGKGSLPSRGSGTEEDLKTIFDGEIFRYKLTATGLGPAGAESQLEVGFYRFGF